VKGIEILEVVAGGCHGPSTIAWQDVSLLILGRSLWSQCQGVEASYSFVTNSPSCVHH
jgi:hypothetical protein